MSRELEKAEKALAQAKARFQKAQSRERQRARKEDTRRKVIIGGALMSLLNAMPPEKRQRTAETLLRHVSERDRDLVEAALRGR